MKPTIEFGQVERLLAEVFGEPARNLQPVYGGDVAQTFSFLAGEQGYILRINRAELGMYFRKEAFIHDHFSSPAVPIPPTLKTGEVAGHAYAISARAPGRPLASAPPGEVQALLPELFRTLHAVHTSDVSPWSGYGVFDENGRGAAESWRAALAGVMEDEQQGIFAGWHALFETSFLERGFYETVYRFLLDHLEYCPEERFLLHGDFGYGNVLAHQGRITAVVDWINAMYGDFVYDIAWLGFWDPRTGYPAMAREYYAGQGLPLARYEERVAGCTAHIGLNALRFYALTGSEEGYEFTRQALEELLAR